MITEVHLRYEGFAITVYGMTLFFCCTWQDGIVSLEWILKLIAIIIRSQVFQRLEGPEEIRRRTELREKLLEGRANFSMAVFNITQDVWSLLTLVTFALIQNELRNTYKDHLNHLQEDEDLNTTFWRALQTYDKITELVTSEGLSLINTTVKSDWDYIQSAFFASTVLTTIGKSLITLSFTLHCHLAH